MSQQPSELNLTMFRQLGFPKKPETVYETRVVDLVHKCLTGLSAVNFFVGPNNSGKSRFMRGIALSRDFPPAVHDKLIVREVERAQRTVATALQSGTPDLQRWKDFAVRIAAFTAGEFQGFDQKGDAERRKHLAQNYGHDHYQAVAKQLGLQVGVLNRMQQLAARNPQDSRTGIPRRIYVPALRSLRRVAPCERTRDPYSKKWEGALYSSFVDSYAHLYMGDDTTVHPLTTTSGGPHVFTGEELFQLIVEHKLGDLRQRELMLHFERFLGERFFGGAEISLIPKLRPENERFEKELLHIKEGKHHDRRIDEVGDGIQQLIILTLPLLLFQDEPLMLFVEEPELYLHPGQQRALLEAWLERSTEKSQIFATTHSQQFLDMTVSTDRVSIYHFTREEVPDGQGRLVDASFKIRRWSNDDLSLLDQLGVRNSSVLLVNATIWVEGITDRLYLRKFIDLLQVGLNEADKIKEDLHYSFVEYGGAAITHWSFLKSNSVEETINVKRLCGDVFLLADKPVRSGRKLNARHEGLQQTLENHYHRWDALEIENLLVPSVLRNTLNALTGGSCKLPENIKHQRYLGKRLGKFVKENLSLGSGPNIFDDDGVIKDKTKFCHEALKHLASADLLCKEARDVTERIIQFVGQKNGLKESMHTPVKGS